MVEENPITIESSFIEKYSYEHVNYVRMQTGIEEPNAELLRKYFLERQTMKDGGTTP